MLPQFPEFKKLALSDKAEIELLTSQYPPYSDFNFVSMWSWDINGNVQICQVNENIAVKFYDYLTEEPFYSFIGTNKVNETTNSLIEFSKKSRLEPILKLVPEETARLLDEKVFNIIEDRDHFDYVLDLKKFAEYQGKHFHSRRKLVNKLLNKNMCRIAVIDQFDDFHISLIHKLLEKIEAQKEHDPLSSPIRKELNAVKRLLKRDNNFKLLTLCVFVDNELCGFATEEIINSDYCVGHFLKADPANSSGVYSLMMQELAKILLQRGCKFINIEQDLGIGGLRFWKMDYQPIFFLKKYKIVEV